MMHGSRLAVLALSTLVLAGCGRQSAQPDAYGALVAPTSAATGSPSGDADYQVDEQQGTDSYPDSGLLIDRNDTKPGIRADAAFAAAKSHGPVPVDGTTRAHLKFIRYTNTHYGSEAADGSIIPIYKNRDVWLVEFPNVPVVARGPVSGTDRVMGTAPVFVIVDANSGEVLESLQDVHFRV